MVFSELLVPFLDCSKFDASILSYAFRLSSTLSALLDDWADPTAAQHFCQYLKSWECEEDLAESVSNSGCTSLSSRDHRDATKETRNCGLDIVLCRLHQILCLRHWSLK